MLLMLSGAAIVGVCMKNNVVVVGLCVVRGVLLWVVGCWSFYMVS